MEEFTRTYLAFEEEVQAFSPEVCGPEWDWLRQAVFYGLLAQGVAGAGEPGRAPERPRRYVDYARQIALGVFRSAGSALRQPRACDVAVLNHWRQNVIQGKQVNMNCFPIIMSLANRYRLLVIDPYVLKSRRALGYPAGVRLLSSFHMLDQAKSRLASRRPSRRLDSLRRSLATKFGTDIALESLYAEERARHIVSYRRLRAVFRKHRPRIILAAHRDFAGAEAAHAFGIPFIELQHSAISPLNIAYSYPAGLRSGQLPTVPDYVFTFGDYWNDKFNMPSVKRSVGYPFFDVMFSAIRQDLLHVAQARRERNVIVIGGFLAKPALVRATLQLSGLLPEWTIYYKLKFSDYVGWQSRYPEEFRTRENIRVIDSNEISLYEYFKVCAYALGVNSGALYEGLACGVTVVLLRAGSYEECRPLVDDGYAFIVNDAREMAGLVRGGARPPKVLRREGIFKPGALANVESEIAAILGAGEGMASVAG